jgi:hypothetical protein
MSLKDKHSGNRKHKRLLRFDKTHDWKHIAFNYWRTFKCLNCGIEKVRRFEIWNYKKKYWIKTNLAKIEYYENFLNPMPKERYIKINCIPCNQYIMNNILK